MAQQLTTTDYWPDYHRCLDRVADEADTVDKLITILNEHHPRSAGEAFHPGGSDRDLWHVLRWERDDWTPVWSKASYWYSMRDRLGHTFTYTEGDIDRGSKA